MLETFAGITLGVVAAKAIEQCTARLVDILSLKFAKDRYDVVKFKLKKGLPDYLGANYAKCETLKTLLNRNDPISLEECFVAPDFNLKGETISSSDFLNHMNQSGGKVVITGLAGCGKSVYLKYSFRRVIEEGHSFYPIFFELRLLNRLSAKNETLSSEIFKSIKSCCETFTRAQFNHGLRSGAFYFLLDGFDELKQEIKEQISSEIKALARNHRKCAILVTSRPSDEFVSWEGFSEARLLPFDLEKAVEYISKLRFDEDKKKEFLEDLQEGLFKKNQDFLSNPLLSAMMLLTYDSFGEIPEKRHTFYSKCFDVLAREHDASKGRYKRELFSNLTIDELEQVFMYFCAFSYVDHQFSFSEEQMKMYVTDAISSCGTDADIVAVIRDFRESISIMELVGLTYEFAHRSFQEYFYARFVVKDRKYSLQEKAGMLIKNYVLDDTIEMIADMDRAYFEDDFLLPYTNSLDVKLSKIDPKTNPSGVLSKFYANMYVEKNRGYSDEARDPYACFPISNDGNHYIWRQTMGKYRDVISSKFEEAAQERDGRFKIMVDILLQEFGGEIKFHHTNNKKLRRVGADHFAEEIKNTISFLRQYLEETQDKRKRGLGALIRSKYVKASPVL